MNSINVFILMELFTFRKYKKVDSFTLANFRHLVTNYIKYSSSYDEFLSLLNTSCMSLDIKVCSLLLSFKKYVEYAYKIWEGNDHAFGYRDRYLHCKVPKI